jgi:hypothetical protein
LSSFFSAISKKKKLIEDLEQKDRAKISPKQVPTPKAVGFSTYYKSLNVETYLYDSTFGHSDKKKRSLTGRRPLQFNDAFLRLLSVNS